MKNLGYVLICLALLLAFQVQAADDDATMTFSHQLHIDGMEMGCLDCHGNAVESEQATDNLMPDMDSCYGCHEPEDISDLSSVLKDTEYIGNFSHAIHADEDNCLNCHAGVEAKEYVGEPYHLPTRESCGQCHAPVDFAEQEDQCYTCHQQGLNLKPESHALNWTATHGLGVDFSEDCSHCHQEYYCTTCHEGDNLDHEVHPFNYKFTHGMWARANKDNCLTCHQEFAFCIDCHQTEFVMPKSHGFANWINNSNGGKHARAAKYDMDNCQTCHNSGFKDVVCQGCHRPE